MPRFCDIIMKGGITSGIVYPAAVFEIAQSYVFKNVGGTSAGAIAAALTAAAERRRARDGSMDGFARIKSVPGYLAADQHLYKLFVPTSSMRSLYRTVVSLFGRPRFQPALVAKWCGLVWAYPFASVVGGIAGLLFLAMIVLTHSRGVLLVVDAAAAVVTLLLGVTVAICLAFARDIIRKLPANDYGMVKGVDDLQRSSPDALCTWLTKELELTAGLEPDNIPLTFGMLWDAKSDSLTGPSTKPATPDVNLAMIATNVTWGRPYQFPNDAMFYYDPDELTAYFPDHVIAWMREHPRAPRTPAEQEHFAAYRQAGKLPLPSAADLPVIVATRMSLAFPILLSAVPFYAVDRTQQVDRNSLPMLQHCWFSDGGISSNFPITLFDSPLPRWPTFAINLGSFTDAHAQDADESKNVYMPKSNAAGVLPTFTKIDALPGFLSAVLGAMQNWNDNTQSHLPGYRDRIVTVLLSATEGGLNLDMPPDVLEKLRLRGEAAGKLIAETFSEPSVLDPNHVGMNWENHRWLRYRSTMGALKTYLTAFKTAVENPQAPDVDYYALIEALAGTPVEHYPIDPAARSDIDTMTKDIVEAGETIAKIATLDDNLPKPPPYLTQRASLDT